MLKDHSTLIKHAIAVADSVLLLGLLYGTHVVVGRHVNLGELLDYWAMFLGFLFFYLYFAWTRSLFSLLQFNMISGLWRRTAAIFFSAAVLGAAILYLLPDLHNSRRLYLVFIAVSCVVLSVEKAALQLVVSLLHRRGRIITPVLLFGRGRDLTRLTKEIACHPEWGLRVQGRLDLSTSVEEFEQQLRMSHVEEVLFCVPRSATSNGFEIDSYLQVCEEMGRPARVFMNIPMATRFARWEYHPFMGHPTLMSHTVELDPDQVLFKRLLDLVGGLVGVMLVILSLPLVCVLVLLGGPGRLFCRRTFVGRNGQHFQMYTYRCTRNCEEGSPLTWSGSLLRACGVERLPVFFNVLRGEMSLVGPRPTLPQEAAAGKTWHRRRTSYKPGFVGLWFLGEEDGVSADEDVRRDLQYIDRWSVWLDISILCRSLIRGLIRPRHIGRGRVAGGG